MEGDVGSAAARGGAGSLEEEAMLKRDERNMCVCVERETEEAGWSVETVYRRSKGASNRHSTGLAWPDAPAREGKADGRTVQRRSNSKRALDSAEQATLARERMTSINEGRTKGGEENSSHPMRWPRC